MVWNILLLQTKNLLNTDHVSMVFWAGTPIFGCLKNLLFLKSLLIFNYTNVFILTQEKGSKRTKRNDPKWKAFVKIKKSVWSQDKQYMGLWERQVFDPSKGCLILPCSLVLKKLHNPDPCYLLITTFLALVTHFVVGNLCKNES